MSKSKSKRKTLAVLAAVAAFAAVSASAASLGPLTSQSLGAGVTVVASCDTDGINVTFATSYVPAAKEFQVSAVNLANLNSACNGQTANLVVSDSGGGQLATITLPISGLSGTTATLNVPLAANLSAKDVAGVAIVISN